jgi:hypothetical protein
MNGKHSHLFISFHESRSRSLLDSTQLLFRPITPSPPTHCPVKHPRVCKAFRTLSKAISLKDGTEMFVEIFEKIATFRTTDSWKPKLHIFLRLFP